MDVARLVVEAGGDVADFGRLITKDDAEPLILAACSKQPSLIFAHWPALLAQRRSSRCLAAIVRSPGRRLVETVRKTRRGSGFGPSIAAAVDDLYARLDSLEVAAALCDNAPPLTDAQKRSLRRILDLRSDEKWRRIIYKCEAVADIVADVLRTSDPLAERAVRDDDALETLAAALPLHAQWVQNDLRVATQLATKTSLAAAHFFEAAAAHPSEWTDAALANAARQAVRWCESPSVKLRQAACRVAAALRRPSADLIAAVASRCAEVETAAFACRALGVAAPLLDEAQNQSAIQAVVDAAHTPKIQHQAAFALGNLAGAASQSSRQKARHAVRGMLTTTIFAGALRAASLLCEDNDDSFEMLFVDACASILRDSFANRKLRRNACAALGVALPQLSRQRDAATALVAYLDSSADTDDDKKALTSAAAALRFAPVTHDALPAVVRAMVRVDNAQFPLLDEPPPPPTKNGHRHPDPPKLTAQLFSELSSLAAHLIRNVPNDLAPNELAPHLDFIYVWLTTRLDSPNDDLADLLDTLATALLAADHSLLAALDRFFARARRLRTARLDDDDEL